MDQVCAAADLPVYIHPTGTKLWPEVHKKKNDVREFLEQYS
jgi:hypothetical protein